MRSFSHCSVLQHDVANPYLSPRTVTERDNNHAAMSLIVVMYSLGFIVDVWLYDVLLCDVL